MLHFLCNINRLEYYPNNSFCLFLIEFIKLNQDNPTQGPEFPVSISHGGMIKYDEKYIFVIGGIQNKETSHKTWILLFILKTAASI